VCVGGGTSWGGEGRRLKWQYMIDGLHIAI
jgi:hypothetical protein